MEEPDLHPLGEDELRLIANSVPALISYVDAEQRYRFNNLRYEEWFGVNVAEMTGLHVRETIGEVAYEKIRPYVEAALAGQDVRFEMWVEYRGAGSRCVEAHYVPHVDPQGKVLGFFALVNDITRYKKTEEALRESEERFRTAVENMLDCLGLYSAVRNEQGEIQDFRIEYVNAAACDNNLMQRQAQIGKLLCEILPGHRESGLFAEYCRVVETGEPLVKETVAYEDDYSGRHLVRSFDIRASKLGDGFLAVWRDVTERKRSEENVQLQAEELAALMDATPAAIWIARDPECRTITGSRAAHELLRAPMGTNLSKTAGEDDPVPHFRVLKDGVELSPDDLPMQRAAHGTVIRDFEEEIVFDDGTRRHLFGNATPLHSPDGSVRGAIGAFVDITQRKQAEEALRQADRRKDEFLAMLAHELRNPLAPIRNAVQVIRHLGSQDPRLLKMYDVLDRQTEQLTRMVDDLLDVSRISQGKIVLRQEIVDVSAILTRAVETSRPLIDKGSHHLKIFLPPDEIQVEGDLPRLAQVVSNLLNNAAKYTEPGGNISLVAAVRGAEVQIRVQDDGIGIAAEILPQVFDLYTQANRALDRAQGGLGIGLALVKNIVELHGGTVQAFSAGPGQGSEFRVTLPLVAGAGG
jgi:PAS domain S-box-containing protein